MIPEKQLENDTPSWQSALINAITDAEELINLLGLDEKFIKPALLAAQKFSLRVPRGFVARMQRGDPNDPLLRQVLPLKEEQVIAADYNADPVGDSAAIQLPGLLHKYKGRVLLIMSGACAVNCRYCFRREFPYTENILSRGQWQQILNYLREDPSIEEVIFSGGDPLVASDKRLADMVLDLENIPHIQRLRIHSRLPIVLPERITESMLQWFTQSRLQPIMVVHSNHPNEINTVVSEVLKRMHQAGVRLYNQAVLLKGVNDNINTLIALQKVLYTNYVQPYYLHLLDQVQGAAHFAVPESVAKALYQELQNNLSGYLVPKLVRENAGMQSKTLIL